MTVLACRNIEKILERGLKSFERLEQFDSPKVMKSLTPRDILHLEKAESEMDERVRRTLGMNTQDQATAPASINVHVLGGGPAEVIESKDIQDVVVDAEVTEILDEKEEG